MPRGDKSTYSEKQKRQAEHIEQGYEQRGVPPEEAEARAWATVNKVSGGGEKAGGSGRQTPPAKKAAARHDVAQRAAASRQRHAEETLSLQAMSMPQLRALAAERQLPGRSRLRKQALIEALLER